MTINPSKNQPFSLAGRTLLASALTLMVILGLVGFFLDRAFTSSTRQEEQSRLHDVGLMLIAQIFPDQNGHPRTPDDWLTDITTPNGPAFVDAEFLSSHGQHLSSPNSPKNLWNSSQDLPQLAFVNTKEGPYFVLTQQLNWISQHGTYPVRFQVAESALNFEIRITEYRRILLASLTLMAIAVLFLQWILLRWSLSPVNQLAQNIRAISDGKKTKIITRQLPFEIRPLGHYINELISHEQHQLNRYRNTCSDLAHSLKTPMAVMRTQIEDSIFSGKAVSTQDMMGQIDRMEKVVTGQLSRAVTGGHTTTSTPIFVAPQAEKLALGLEKLYASRKIYCEFDIDDKAQFFGSEGDLLDLMGNLLDNAFKWANQRVLLRAHVIPGQKRPGLMISIEDDGPGVEFDKMDIILSRGGRLDEHMAGQGLGLSNVQELVKSYHAEFEIGSSSELGGANFTIRFLN